MSRCPRRTNNWFPVRVSQTFNVLFPLPPTRSVGLTGRRCPLGLGRRFADAGPLKALKRDLVTQLERNYLASALRRSGGNIAAAARASGTPRRAFFELMRKRGVTAKPGSGA